MPPRKKPTKKMSDAPDTVRRLHPNREPANPWQPTPVEAAIMAHDRAMTEVERRWGVETLQDLVSPETAAKFASACCRRDEAIQSDEQDQIIHRLNVVVKGLAAMEREAEAMGIKPLDAGEVWPASDESGGQWLFCATEAAARQAGKDPRWKGYAIWSMPEVMRVLSENGLEAVLAIKRTFGEAVVTKVKADPDWKKGDEVGL